MKKVFSILLAFVLVFAFSACTNTSTDAQYTIGIVEYSDHSAQNQAVQGFIDVLTEKLGDNVDFVRQHASGDAGNASLIVNNFLSQNVDLIMADTTQSLQIAASSTSDTPILGAAITDYASAIGTSFTGDYTGLNISGTSDLAPIDQQAEMILELFPEIDKLAILYCSSEVNSEYQASQIVSYLFKKGIMCNEFSFTDSNDLAALVSSACENYDVIFIPTDNTIAECATIVANICRPAGVAVIAGEKGLCESCGAATLSIDYYTLGRKTGEMAYRILAEGADISQMPIEYDENCLKMYNPEICSELNLTVPEDYSPLK